MDVYLLSNILRFWGKASPKQKRLYSIIFIFILTVVVTLAGTLVPLTADEANTIYDQVNQTLAENTDLPSLTGAIFVNNFLLCLIMFIPVAGAVFGFFTLFSTGTALAAISTATGIPVIINFVLLVMTPIFWLEFVSYTMGITESIWLFRRLTQKRWRELKWTAAAIGITAGLLAVGAVVEAWMILAAGV
jgi:hypothetical protein